MNTEPYKNKLLAEKAILDEELSAMATRDPITKTWEAQPEGQTFPEADENDLSTRATDYEERSAMTNTLDVRIRDVAKALKNIENGVYGICEVCGKHIEEERLAANPAARTCVADMNL